jgi:hypothetical protein
VTETCEWFTNKPYPPNYPAYWCCDTHMYDGTGDYPASGDHPEACPFSEAEEEEVKATDLFGETFEGLDLHSHRIKDGTAYYTVQMIDNTRRVYPQYTLTIIWDDGERGDTVVLDSDEELKLWTVGLE